MVLGPHCVVIGHTATGHSHTGRTLGSERSTEADCCTQDIQDDGLKQHWGASWDKLVRLDCPEHHSPFLLLIPRFERTPQLSWPQPCAVSSSAARVERMPLQRTAELSLVLASHNSGYFKGSCSCPRGYVPADFRKSQPRMALKLHYCLAPECEVCN